MDPLPSKQMITVAKAKVAAKSVKRKGQDES